MIISVIIIFVIIIISWLTQNKQINEYSRGKLINFRNPLLIIVLYCSFVISYVSSRCRLCLNQYGEYVVNSQRKLICVFTSNPYFKFFFKMQCPNVPPSIT